MKTEKAVNCLYICRPLSLKRDQLQFPGSNPSTKPSVRQNQNCFPIQWDLTRITSSTEGPLVVMKKGSCENSIVFLFGVLSRGQSPATVPRINCCVFPQNKLEINGFSLFSVLTHSNSIGFSTADKVVETSQGVINYLATLQFALRGKRVSKQKNSKARLNKFPKVTQ